MTERDTAKALRDQLLSAFALLTLASFNGHAARYLLGEWPWCYIETDGFKRLGMLARLSGDRLATRPDQV